MKSGNRALNGIMAVCIYYCKDEVSIKNIAPLLDEYNNKFEYQSSMNLAQKN